MAAPASSYDVAVIGLGAAGAATLYQLAGRGIRAVGIDRYSPPHELGSTHGETRITRQAIGEGVAYVPLALRSHEIWRQLEAETGEKLLTQSGCLIIGRMDEEANGPIRSSFLATTQGVAKTFGIDHEILGPADIQHRYPQFTPESGEMGYFEPGGGYLSPERCVAAQLVRANEMGASIWRDTSVLSLTSEEGAVRIVTDKGSILAERVVVAAGAWAPALLGAPFDRLLIPRRQVMHWFEIESGMVRSWNESPVFIWAPGSDPKDFFYGFPSLPGTNLVKTAGEQYDEATTPETINRHVELSETQAMYRDHLAGRVQGLKPVGVKAITCFYTVTPDSDFLIDHHPDSDRILVASPCSGHGFKHSAALGELVAQILADGESTIDRSAFLLKRFESAPL